MLTSLNHEQSLIVNCKAIFADEVINDVLSLAPSVMSASFVQETTPINNFYLTVFRVFEYL